MFRQDLRDFFRFLPFRLPAIARRSGEAGGEERQKTQSACGGKLPVHRYLSFQIAKLLPILLFVVDLFVGVCSNFLILRSKINR